MQVNVSLANASGHLRFRSQLIRFHESPAQSGSDAVFRMWQCSVPVQRLRIVEDVCGVGKLLVSGSFVEKHDVEPCDACSRTARIAMCEHSCSGVKGEKACRAVCTRWPCW